jgi:tRNA (guanine37-N1)-methyltransferase
MHFHIITLFPKAFDSYLGESILKRAIEDKKLKVSFYNPRDFSDNEYKRIDRKPFAGGPGMVIQAEPVILAIAEALKKCKKSSRTSSAKASAGQAKIIFLSPSGKQFTNEYAKTMSKKTKDIIIVSGRYEGIDARVKKVFKMEDVSIGPFILTGGELPAMLLIDVIARQVEGVLGNFNSLEERRVSTWQVYTRPEVFTYKGKKYRVPRVLLSGNHGKIEDWRKAVQEKKLKNK